MSERKVMVTGGAGFIGSHIVDALLNKGYKVVIVDDLSTGVRNNINNKAKFYNADIRDIKKLREIFRKEKPDILNHHAAQISVTDSVKDPKKDIEINYYGTLNLLKCAIDNCVEKIIFASSSAIYGEVKKSELPVSESLTPRPLTPYGINKYACELCLEMFFRLYGLPYISLRYSNVFGPRQNAKGEAGVIAIFTTRMLRGKTPLIYGDGYQTRDFIYVDDVVRANILAIENKKIKHLNLSIINLSKPKQPDNFNFS